MRINQHPDYHEGFFDALDGEPIFEDECSPEYAAGWLAYWEVHDILHDPDFVGSPHEAKLPADTDPVRMH